ncbi:hypothetical protein K431DRAFT_278254 [Polychaeton citri CBS 116435]|uniref:Uncharacterized protein n=1 Tax=Polychaeton citri CBS 116435 TaxID=1314669 RepID=A0A9P4UKG8_9PEZI|nr:hypothetical protein K431DRAFT_278254 [Polychaeton citri CBS 116435]
MAENSPLSAAHTHARKAASETKQVNWKQAAEEHQRAAVEFARASRSTNDSEALRILSLLEEQHKKLATLIKAEEAPKEAALNIPKNASATSLNALKVDPPSVQASANPTSSAIAAVRLERQARDSSPSLARDIASRRGIPTPIRSHPSAAAQARARPVSPESTRREKPMTHGSIPPSVVDSQALLKKTKILEKPEDDEGFSKFYSSITTGTMSKLSSVLAYAGLPLTQEDKIQESNPGQKPSKTVKANNDPDVSRLFSKAALDAIEESHRQQGSHGNFFGPAESFYVVQKGGGTFSYADIAKAHQQQQQQLAGIDEEDEEAFVDAREVPGPGSPKHNRRASIQQRSSFGKSRTSEELELENTTLKTTLEQLAHRLTDFERHAQDANMEALNQSILSMRSGAHNDDGSRERLRILEQQIESQIAERQKQDALIAKQREQIKKYHAKWEEVKNSARERRKKEKERTNEDGASETPTASV